MSISLSVSLTLVSSISYPPSQLISQLHKVAILQLDTQVPQVQAQVATVTTMEVHSISQHPLFILHPPRLIPLHHPAAVITVL